MWGRLDFQGQLDFQGSNVGVVGVEFLLNSFLLFFISHLLGIFCTSFHLKDIFGSQCNWLPKFYAMKICIYRHRTFCVSAEVHQQSYVLSSVSCLYSNSSVYLFSYVYRYFYVVCVWYVHLYVVVYMCGAHNCVYACRGQSRTPGAIFYCSLCYCLETVSHRVQFTWPEPVPPLHHWGYGSTWLIRL